MGSVKWKSTVLLITTSYIKYQGEPLDEVHYNWVLIQAAIHKAFTSPINYFKYILNYNGHILCDIFNANLNDALLL